MAQLMIRVTIDICQVGAGVGAVMAGQSQANNPGFGGSAGPGEVGNAQTMRLQDAVQVPGTAGSVSLANINTALTQAVADFAASSGTVLITTPILATINGWQSGNP